MSSDQSLQTQLKDAIARGDKDAAASLMRQGGLTGLLQTMRAVQASARQESLKGTAKDAPQLPASAKLALQNGNLIEAIKQLRAANPGLSLKDAKDHVDALRAAIPKHQAQRTGTTFAQVRERTPTVVMGDKPGNLRWLFVLIAFVAVAWWFIT